MATTTINLNNVAAADEIEQKDFVKIADNSKANYGELLFRRVNSATFNIAQKIDAFKYSLWSVIKDANDDFWKLGKCSLVDMSVINNVLKTRKSTFLDKVNPVISGNNYHTTTIGDIIYTTFKGTKIELRHFSDTRGGIWKFTLNGDASTEVIISTYSASSGANISLIYDDLPEDTYLIEGEFMGDDPDNPPSATARGWFFYDTTINSSSLNTFFIYGNAFIDSNETQILATTSNKEMAFSVRQSGSTNNRQWIPDHGVGTTFGNNNMFADDLSFLNMIPNMGGFLPCEKVTIENDMIGKNTLDDVDLIDVKTFLVFNAKNVELNCCFEFLENTDIGVGYVNMIPILISSFGTLFIDSRMNAYDISLTSGQTYSPFRDNLKSVALIDENSDYFLAATFNGNLDTFLKNRTNYRVFSGGFESRFWMQHRDATLNKFYPQTYINEIIDAGFIHQTQMTLSVGNLANAFDLFKKPIVTN